MAEQLLERISANNLNDDDKEQLTNLIKPKIPYHRREETKEKIRLRYRDDEEYRQKALKQRLDYYYKITADKEKQKRGRKQIYENEEEKRRITNENMKAKYHEKTKDLPKQTRGRKPMTLEQKIEKLTENFNK
jgi:hypothetical protein